MQHSTLSFHKCLRVLSLGVTLVASSQSAHAGFEMAPDVNISSSAATTVPEAIASPQPAVTAAQPATTTPVSIRNTPSAPVNTPIDVAKEKAELAAAIRAEDQEPIKPPQECWIISPSQQKLSTAMEEWSKKAGWQMLWERTKDFPIDVNGTFCSSYFDAVKTVLETYRTSDSPVKAKFYRGNNVVRYVELNK